MNYKRFLVFMMIFSLAVSPMTSLAGYWESMTQLIQGSAIASADNLMNNDTVKKFFSAAIVAAALIAFLYWVDKKQ